MKALRRLVNTVCRDPQGIGGWLRCGIALAAPYLEAERAMEPMIDKRAGMAGVLAAFFAALALTGCNTVKSGEIVAKEHEPERTYVRSYPMCFFAGKVSVCSRSFWVVRDDEDWKLRLRDGEKKGWVFVDHATWEQADIGTHFDGEKTAETDDPVERLRPADSEERAQAAD